LNGKVFLLQRNELVEMEEREYISEDVLQDLIAKYPNLLAGEQMNEAEPRKWLLVQREQVLPYDNTGLKLFYLDHLFLDQDGVPTIVETKRSSDSRLRREVVAQMLDYAANALIYLPVEVIQTNLNVNYPDTDQEDLLNQVLGLDISPDEFWEQVKTNLQAGKIRLVFVADSIPNELRTIVEFLNIQMDPAELFVVEVKQYVSEGLKTLVPRLVGQTAEAQIKKDFSNNKLDENTFFEHLDTEEAIFYRKLLDYSRDNQLSINWSPKSFSINIVDDTNHINLLRGYCNLSAFGQTLFATAGSIIKNVPNGETILHEYDELDFANKIQDGYGFNIKEMNEEQIFRFYEVLSKIVNSIKFQI
jgi:hypothetical protein